MEETAPTIPEASPAADLPAHWCRLDAFQGLGCRRTLVTLTTAAGPVAAGVYALAEPAPDVDPASNA